MTRLLKQSTAKTLRMGPFLDSTDGVTAETGLTIAQADIQISKNGAAFGQTSEGSPTTTHDADGWYQIPLTATDTETCGPLTVQVTMSGALPVWEHFHVVAANVYDSLAAASGTDYLDVSAVQFAGQTITAAAGVTVGAYVGGTGAAALEATAQTILGDTNELQTDWTNGGRLDLIVDAILADTGTDGVVVAAASKTGYSLTAGTGLGNQTAIISGSITSVGTVTGNVSGSVGSVAGNVVGTVGGVAGSVSGSVLGNVSGSVGSIASGGITSASFASGAITGTAFASAAITASTLGSGTITAAKFGAGAITSTVIADDAITAAKFDETTAFPLTSADSGATYVARAPGGTETLDTLATDIAAVKTDTGNLVTRITATLFSGITSLANWIGLLAGKTADATTRAEVQATAAGATYDERSDSLEAIRDRGDQAWLTGSSGTASATYTTESWTRTVGGAESGTGSDTTTVNATYFSTREVTSGTYLEVDAVFTITDGERGISLDVWGFYNGGASHSIQVQAYNATDSTWEPIGVIGQGTTVQKYSFSLTPGHTNTTTDQVLIKFIHQGGSGVASHVLSIDKAEINTAVPVTSLTAADIVNEWEIQSQADPTGFHVNVKEVNGTAQTAGDIPGVLAARLVGTILAGNHTAQSGDSYAYLGTNLGLLGANATALASASALTDGSVVVGTINDGAIGADAVADIFSTTAITEAYAASGAAGTVAQILYLIQQSLHEFEISSTTRTVKKLDAATTAATFTLDDADAPTSTTRAS